MHMSRQLEETKKTKFRGGREEGHNKKQIKSKPKKRDHKTSDSQGYDMWRNDNHGQFSQY